MTKPVDKIKVSNLLLSIDWLYRGDGSLDSYYLYEEDAADPKYGLTFDHDASVPAVMVQLFRYE